MIDIKSENELRLISEAGRVVKLILEELKVAARPGITTASLAEKAEEIIKKCNSRSAFNPSKSRGSTTNVSKRSFPSRVPT